MPGKTVIYGAAIGPHAVAVTDGAIEGTGTVAVELGGTPVVIVRGGDSGVRAFRAEIGDRHLSLSLRKGSLVDEETGSTWDPVSGSGTAGSESCKVLQPVTVTTAFWFAWSSFYPNTQVIDRPQPAR